MKELKIHSQPEALCCSDPCSALEAFVTARTQWGLMEFRAATMLARVKEATICFSH